MKITCLEILDQKLTICAMMSVAAALDVGFVDETAPEESLEQKAIEKIASLAKYPRDGFAAIKANLTDSIHASYHAGFEKKNAQFIDCWFSKNVQEFLFKAVEKF